MKLIYVLDPMCSWCWGFQAGFNALLETLPADTSIEYVMGGLAPDSEQPMPEAMQHHLQDAWRAVAQRTGANFNHAFWTECSPRRSTYPACRAVIAAGLQDEASKPKMINGIQQAYYQYAQNPADVSTLTNVAASIGLNVDRFKTDIESAQVETLFAKDRHKSQVLGVQGFPSLLVEANNQTMALTYGWCDKQTLLARFDQAFATVSRQTVN